MLSLGRWSFYWSCSFFFFKHCPSSPPAPQSSLLNSPWLFTCISSTHPRNLDRVSLSLSLSSLSLLYLPCYVLISTVPSFLSLSYLKQRTLRPKEKKEEEKPPKHLSIYNLISTPSRPSQLIAPSAFMISLFPGTYQLSPLTFSSSHFFLSLFSGTSPPFPYSEAFAPHPLLQTSALTFHFFSFSSSSSSSFLPLYIVILYMRPRLSLSSLSLSLPLSQLSLSLSLLFLDLQCFFLMPLSFLVSSFLRNILPFGHIINLPTKPTDHPPYFLSRYTLLSFLNIWSLSLSLSASFP